MLTVILGFTTSLVYGFADFFGAIAAKKIPPVAVTFFAGVSGLVFLITLIPTLGADFSSGALFWGGVSGIASALAISCLYASLAIGPISIVSPLGAVVSAIVPMIVGLSQGDRISAWGGIALVAILIAVVLVGFIPGENVKLPSIKGLMFALAAGVGIGIVLITLDQAPSDSGLAPVIILRSVSAGLLGSFLAIRLLGKRANGAKRAASGETAERKSRIPRKYFFAILVAGVFDASANVFFISAIRLGSLSVVSVLTALYPLGTIVMARIFLKEKIAGIQQVGILLALAASAVLAIS